MNLATSLSNGDSALVFQTPTGVDVELLDANFDLVSGPSQIASGVMPWLGASPSADGFTVSWQNSAGALYAEDFNTSGQAVSGPYSVASFQPQAGWASTSNAFPSSTNNPAHVIVADAGTVTATFGGDSTLTIVKTDARGNPVGSPYVADNVFSFDNPVALAPLTSNGGYVAEFIVEGPYPSDPSYQVRTLEAVVFSPSGDGLTQVQVAQGMNPYASYTQLHVIGLPDGGFVAGFSNTGPLVNDPSLQLQEFDAQGRLVATHSPGFGALNHLEALPNGQYAITWTDSIDGQPTQTQVFTEQGASLGIIDPPPQGNLSIAGPGALHEGDSGTTDFAFTVTRTGDLSASALVDYYQAYGGTADNADFAGPTAGTVAFAAGQSTATVHIAVNGDIAVEPDESFTIALANARGATIDANAGSAAATILNDDTATSPPPGSYALSDGGYVVIDSTNSGQFAQKYDASGAAVGSAVQLGGAFLSVTALSNGGYVLLDSNVFADTVQVIDAANHQTASSYSGAPSYLVAAPAGGFLIVSQGFSGHQLAPDPTVVAYDNSGAVLASGVYAQASPPTASVDDQGHYVVVGALFQPLVIDPANPAAALASPGPVPGTITGYDDHGAAFGNGAVIGDFDPTFRVPVTATGAIETYYTSAMFIGGNRFETTVTASDVAAGYKDVVIPHFLDPGLHRFTFAEVSDTGLVGPATELSETVLNPLSITGPGSVSEGDDGTTDFAFTVTRGGVSIEGGAVDYFLAYGGTADSSDFAGPTAGTVYFQASQTSATIHIAVSGDVAVEPDETFTIALSNARNLVIDQTHASATATIVNDDGGSSTGGSSSVSTSDPDYTAPSGVHTITLSGTSSQTVHGNNEGDTFWSNNNANTLYGGTGDDTFHLGRNGDVATGGGGNDIFAFAENPWSPAGRITDFNAGDVIDLTETLHRAGYSSGDPIAEGYVKFASDSSGNAQVWFDPDPSHSATFWLVTGLDGVDAASLHANAGLITI